MKYFLFILFLICSACGDDKSSITDVLIEEQNDAINRMVIYKVDVDIKVNGHYGDTVYLIATRNGSYFVCNGDSAIVNKDGSITTKKVNWAELDAYADSLIRKIANK